MASEKLLPAHVGIYAAYPEYAVDPLRPTAAELNNLFVYGTNEDGMVFNISCAITDDYTLNQTGSDTDDTRTICDEGEVSNPTFWNYDASLDGLRDRDLDAQGVYNLFAELFRGVDCPFYLIKRIGPDQAAAFAVDQEVSIYGVTTDYPVDVFEDGELVQHGARFKTTGEINVNYKIAA